eukprot:GHVU01127604.1.p1 GENE.GHVU01127604.1~~GHVU01127604.1.p1  ORF type:complete len:114 (+),score=1.15 GHVU01127604.1:218-559(+)
MLRAGADVFRCLTSALANRTAAFAVGIEPVAGAAFMRRNNLCGSFPNQGLVNNVLDFAHSFIYTRALTTALGSEYRSSHDHRGGAHSSSAHDSSLRSRVTWLGERDWRCGWRR